MKPRSNGNCNSIAPPPPPPPVIQITDVDEPLTTQKRLTTLNTLQKSQQISPKSPNKTPSKTGGDVNKSQRREVGPKNLIKKFDLSHDDIDNPWENPWSPAVSNKTPVKSKEDDYKPLVIPRRENMAFVAAAQARAEKALRKIPVVTPQGVISAARSARWSKHVQDPVDRLLQAQSLSPEQQKDLELSSVRDEVEELRNKLVTAETKAAIAEELASNLSDKLEATDSTTKVLRTRLSAMTKRQMDLHARLSILDPLVSNGKRLSQAQQESSDGSVITPGSLSALFPSSHASLQGPLALAQQRAQVAAEAAAEAQSALAEAEAARGDAERRAAQAIAEATNAKMIAASQAAQAVAAADADAAQANHSASVIKSVAESSERERVKAAEISLGIQGLWATTIANDAMGKELVEAVKPPRGSSTDAVVDSISRLLSIAVPSAAGRQLRKATVAAATTSRRLWPKRDDLRRNPAAALREATGEVLRARESVKVMKHRLARMESDLAYERARADVAQRKLKALNASVAATKNPPHRKWAALTGEAVQRRPSSAPMIRRPSSSMSKASQKTWRLQAVNAFSAHGDGDHDDDDHYHLDVQDVGSDIEFDEDHGGDDFSLPTPRTFLSQQVAAGERERLRMRIPSNLKPAIARARLRGSRSEAAVSFPSNQPLSGEEFAPRRPSSSLSGAMSMPAGDFSNLLDLARQVSVRSFH